MGKVTKLKPRKRPAQQLVVHQPQQPLTPMQQTLAMIERAASDPTIDVAKMRELIEIRDREFAKEEQRIFWAAHHAAQSQMRRVVTDKDNTQTRSRYASLSALDRAIRPIYTAHGFTITFDTEELPRPEVILVVGYLSHISGHMIRRQFPAAADGKGAKGGDVMTKTHAAMSAVTSGRRIVLKMLWNLAEADEDDDGNLAGVTEFITNEQAETLETLIKDAGRTVEHFCATQKIDALLELPAHRYQAAMAMVARALAEKKGARKS